MHSFILQDWITIRGNAVDTQTISQSDEAHLDLSPFQDVTFHLQVSGVTTDGNAPTLRYDTAAVKDESNFVEMKGGSPNQAPITLSAPPSGTPPIVTIFRLSDNPAVPLGRWVRWRLAVAGANNWAVTFRIIAVAS